MFRVWPGAKAKASFSVWLELVLRLVLGLGSVLGLKLGLVLVFGFG